MSSRLAKGRGNAPTKPKGKAATTKGKPATKGAKSKATNNKKQPQQQQKRHQVQDDDDSVDIEIDGEYDFSSDVEVMDLSAMLDEPEERQKQVRKGGTNKQLKPTKRAKRSNDDDLEEEDEEIDSDLDISTADDFFIKDTSRSTEPISKSNLKPTKPPTKMINDTQSDDNSELEDEGDEMDDIDDDDEDDTSEDEDKPSNTKKTSTLFNNDESDSQSGSDSESNTKPSALEEYLSRFEPKAPKNPEKTTKAEQLRLLAKNTRRKGELFSAEDQIGDESIEVGLNNLQSAVGRLEGSSTNPFGQSNSGPLSVSSLLASLKSSAHSKTATTDLATNSMLASLKAPSLRKLEQQTQFVINNQTTANQERLGDVARGRIERKELYTDKAQDISKFQGVIQHNRGVQTLDLTKQQKPQKNNNATSGAFVDQFTVTNELEDDLDTIISMVGRDQAEKAKENRDKQIASMHRDLSIEELEEKSRYMAKMKLSAFFEQQRAARIAKVKSRAQRKYLRTQEEKVKRQALQNGLDGKEGGMSKEELEELELQFEKQRIRERATLSHKNTSQWAKRQLRISEKNKDARQLLQDQLNLGQQLRVKLGHKQDADGFDYSDDDDGQGDESAIGSDDDEAVVMRKHLDKLRSKPTAMADEDGGKKAKGSALLNLPFMKRAEEELKRRNDLKLAELRKDWALEEQYGSDDEGNTTINGTKLDQNSAEYKTAITSKENRLKKSYGPSSGVGSKSTTSSLPSMSDITNAYETDANQPTTISAAATTTKSPMGSMFGGIFDLDDNELISLTKQESVTASVVPSALSLVQQQQQRDKILNSMRQAAGKAPVREEPSPSTITITKSTKSTTTTAQRSQINNNSNDDKPVTKQNDDVGQDSDNNCDNGDDDESDEEANPWLVKAQPTKLVKKSKTVQVDTNISLDMTESLLLASVASNKVATEKVKQENQQPTTKKEKKLKQNDLVSLAFASASNQDEEFERLKLQEMEGDLPKMDKADGMAGWGSWAGVEKTKSQLQREAVKKEKKAAEIKAQRDAILSARTDARLSNVIVNQKKDQHALKYQMQAVPRQFSNVEEYKSSLRTPLGREWNTAHGFRELNKPEMIVNTGQVIQAMKWNKSMEQYSKRGDIKPQVQKDRTAEDDEDDDGKNHIPKDKASDNKSKSKDTKKKGSEQGKFTSSGPRGPTIRKNPPGKNDQSGAKRQKLTSNLSHKYSSFCSHKSIFVFQFSCIIIPPSYTSQMHSIPRCK